MQIPNPRLARRRRLVAFAGAAAVLALFAALVSLCDFSLVPPGIALKDKEGAAVTRALVQPQPAEKLIGRIAVETGAKRAILVGNLIATAPVVDRVGHLVGIDPDRIAATAEASESVPVAFNEPDSERRASQILDSHDPFRIDIQAQTGVPVLNIYSQAPSVGQAEAIANAVPRAANEYLRQIARRHDDLPVSLNLAQLGPARGGALDPGAAYKIAALTFLSVFGISLGLLLGLAQIRRGWLRAGQNGERPESAAGRDPEADPARRRLDDWPHTSRVLPWMIAVFIGMLWLVPINAITIQASLPIDLKLDRLVLPVIVVTWLVLLAQGGPSAPRWRFTTIHAAIAIFVGIAFFSVVLNATYLSHTLELELAIKKLTLLAAFFTLFLVVASSVRPREVRPLMTLTLVLAVICALGILYEYRFGSNIFYGWSEKLLPGFFQVAPVDTTGYDEIGRRAVIGSADLSLEAVAMLSLALPIAFVRAMHSKGLAERLLCGLAICVLLGAMIATYRKSALLAPLTVVLVLAYFRRRELLRLAPLGVIILLAIPALAPNALGSIVDQFEPNRLGVSTVSDRISDYDAIRPDLLSHLAFGRGFGSYEHTIYRVLDNDLLMRVIETGLVGLAAFILMLVTFIVAASPIIRGRDPNWAPPALAVAAAAGAFLVLSALFDIMSFPHGPYILMVLAGLLAVVVGAAQDEGSRRPHGRPAAVPEPSSTSSPPADGEKASSIPIPI